MPFFGTIAMRLSRVSSSHTRCLADPGRGSWTVGPPSSIAPALIGHGDLPPSASCATCWIPCATCTTRRLPKRSSLSIPRGTSTWRGRCCCRSYLLKREVRSRSTVPTLSRAFSSASTSARYLPFWEESPRCRGHTARAALCQRALERRQATHLVPRTICASWTTATRTMQPAAADSTAGGCAGRHFQHPRLTWSNLRSTTLGARRWQSTVQLGCLALAQRCWCSCSPSCPL
mmetsp:Transcript_26112/g.52774  ORF Transcript_26112/g.52774 Transcript_26112/m.52774 type:complete len:232 (+) Transcript_26112:552-1247(+)